jgi:hypothetical protein
MKDEQHRCSKRKKDPRPFSAFELVSSDLKKQDHKRQEEKNGYGPGPTGKNDSLILYAEIQGIIAQQNENNKK